MKGLEKTMKDLEKMMDEFFDANDTELSDNQKEFVKEASEINFDNSERLEHPKEMIPAEYVPVTFTLDQVKALLSANMTIPGSKSSSDDLEDDCDDWEPEEETDPSIDEFHAVVEDSMPEGMHILDSYQNWILMCCRKTYLIPPVKSLSTHQEVVRTSGELKEEVLFKTFLIQFGENTEEESPLIIKLKNEGVEVLRPYRLSYIKRMLMEI